MTKVLRVIHSLNPLTGGPAEGIKVSVSALLTLGIHSTILTLDSPGSRWLENYNCKVIALGSLFPSYGFSLRLITLIHDIAATHDYVIIEGLFQFHSVATYLALRDLSTPYFIYPHGMLDPWFKKAKPFKHLLKSFYWHLVERTVVTNAQSILFTTQTESDLSDLSFGPITCNQRRIVGYGCYSPSFNDVFPNVIDRYPQLANSPYLLYLGRIDPKKGISPLIEAFALFVSQGYSGNLVIAGTGSSSYVSSLKTLAYDLSVSNRVAWVGYISGDSKWSLIKHSSLFCLTSYQENFGLAIAEALSLQIPVLVSESVNIHDDVRVNNAGFVCRPNAISILESLIAWQCTPLNDINTIKANARKLFLSRYDINVVTRQLMSSLEPTFQA